jgi:hypothetical protein
MAVEPEQDLSRFRGTGNPKLSVVVVVHNMAREAPRTLFSLSARYQRDIDKKDY